MRHLVCASLGCLLAGCAAPAPIISSPLPLESATVIARSREVFEAERRHDKNALNALLSDQYVYLSSVGHADRRKAEEMALQLQVTVQSYSIEKARTVPISRDSAALHYFAHQKLSRAGRAAICPYSAAMEIWRVEHGSLRMVARTEWLVGTLSAPLCA